LLPTTVNAQPSASCAVLIQFYNQGTPGAPGISPDSRYGVRLDVQDVGPIVLASDREGFVCFYTTTDTVVPFHSVALYLDPLNPGSGIAHEAGCGFTPIQVPAGT
jgi:hypothetical protein